MSSYLTIPNSNITLCEGSVVILHRYPETQWIVHQGWYDYAGSHYNGWYFCSIPAQTIIPMNQEDLAALTVVSGGPRYCPEVPYPPMPGPFPPAPGPFPPLPVGDLPAYISNDEKARYEAAFISLPMISDRDALDTEKLPDGKIVRVNNVDGVAKYYAWDKFNETWADVTFPSDEPEPQPAPESDILYVTVDTSDETITLSESYQDILSAVESNRLPILIHVDDMLYFQQQLDSGVLQFARINCTASGASITVIEVDDQDTVTSYILNLSAEIAE